MLHSALRTIREIHRFQQSEMAEKLHISRSHLSEIESGKKGVSVELLTRYADAFDVPASTLLSFAEALDGPSPRRQENAKKLLGVLNWVMDTRNEDGGGKRSRT